MKRNKSVRQRLWVGVVSALLMATVGGTAVADLVLDQQQTEWTYSGQSEPWWYRDSAGTSDGYFGQSFTAGVTGRLAKIEVNITCIYPGGSPTLKVYEGHFVPFADYGEQLYSGSVDLSAVPSGWATPFGPAWYTLELTSPLQLTAGEQYTFILSGPDQTNHLINKGNPYLGGYAFAGAHVDQNVDNLFKTWVEPATVPVPGAVLLGWLGLGAAGAGFRRWHARA